MQAPKLAIKEMERCVKELGFPGVQIGSHINTWDLNEQELFQFYEVSMQLKPCQGTTAEHPAGAKHCFRGWWGDEDTTPL